jgi:uncharacterized protein YggE
VVEVTGNATIEVQPDIMNWDLKVQDDNDNLNTAVSNNESSTGKILDYLKSLGIKSEKISTSGLRVTKNYSYNDYKIKKYTVTNSVWFSVSDINMYQILTDYFVSFDNVFINNTVLAYSNEIETRKQARINALKAAKEKAEMMAGVFGKEIGDPIMITEEPMNQFYGYTMQNVMISSDVSGNDTGQNFSRGMINVTAKVKVVFLIK